MYGISEDRAATERAKLFDLIEDLVLWENSNNPTVINKARLEIARSIAANKVADGELTDKTKLVADSPELLEEQAKYLPDPPPEYTPHEVRFKMPGLKPEQVDHFLAHYAPPVLDPFAGGGSIPLEAQRLGLRAYASDLNPVPVLINKALIEIPPKFANQPPVNPDAQKGKLKNAEWRGSQGLAEDVRYYGKWMRDEAEKRIGHLYPKVKVTQEMVDDGRPDLEPYVGQDLTVIAWVWARTVPSPNPAFRNTHVPLLRAYWLSKKKGQEAYVNPNVKNGSYKFKVCTDIPVGEFDPSNGTVVRTGGTCLVSNSPMSFEYIRNAAKEGRMKQQLMAIVCSTGRRRVYLDPLECQESVALEVKADNFPITDLPEQALSFRVQLYGMNEHWKLFTQRQLVALVALSDLVEEAQMLVLKASSGASLDSRTAYSHAVATLLGMTVSRTANSLSTLSIWSTTRGQSINAFGRQALPMTWDFPEVNPFAGAAGDFAKSCKNVAKTIERLPASGISQVSQQDARSKLPTAVISTDPPYYDNIGYADLSDFFYVWIRKSLKSIYPQLLGTLLTPKNDELIATPYRHEGSRKDAAKFFESGLQKAISQWRNSAEVGYPITVFYAFKQEETDTAGTASTGWETFLTGLIENKLVITATWPMRTERDQGLKTGSNVLASSIVLACVSRSANASIVTRRDFANALRKELPEAIQHLQSGNVAPVDLAQASIGPGMAVFSRYAKVVNADGSPMTVREALQLINQVLDESLVEQESDFDPDTRFALRWYDQYGMDEGPFGDAEVLAKAMAVSVSGVVEAGIVKSGAGKVRLLKRGELNEKWTPATDQRLTMWEVTQYLIRRLESDGEQRTAELLVELLDLKGSEYVESVRELSYRLYQTCERAKRAEEARSYNGLVVAWPEVFRLTMQLKQVGTAKVQGELL